MIKFIRPTNFNGADLEAELLIKGIKLQSLPEVIGDDLFLAIDESESTVAAEVVKNHNGTIVAPEQTITEKLASLGINLQDIKTALGL